MTGIERLRELADDMYENKLWSSILCGREAKYETVRGDEKTVNDLLRYIADQIAREQDAMVKDSPYDAILPEDREAVAWVRDHGGLERVKWLLDWCLSHGSKIEQLDFDFWLSGRVMHELGFEEDMADRDEVERRLLARLMPEGMEWPRFEDGALVKYGDVVSDVTVRSVVFREDGILLSDCTSVPGWGTFRSYTEPIKRHAPKVLDADGVEIREGDTAWSTVSGDRQRIEKISQSCDGIWAVDDDGITSFFEPSQLTHRAPVLAADGRPLREGETVYHVADGRACVVREVRENGAVVEPMDGRPCGRCRADYLTHERPDSYDALWEDIENCAVGYEGFMSRAKALAERDR